MCCEKPAKSTGRERYGTAEAEALARGKDGRALDDLLATLVAFTAEAVARACNDFLATADPKEIKRVLVCGGGARNPALMAALAEALPHTAVEPTDEHGVPSDAVEALAFALMGRNAILGIPNHLPRCTGASHATILGEIAPGRTGRP